MYENWKGKEERLEGDREVREALEGDRIVIDTEEAESDKKMALPHR